MRTEPSLTAYTTLAKYEKQLRQYYAVKSKLMEEIDSLDPDDKHYYKRKTALDDRLCKMYDKIEDTENLPIIEEDMGLSLDNDVQVETVCLLSRNA